VLSKETYGATRVDACPSIISKLSVGILRLVTLLVWCLATVFEMGES